MEAEGSQAKRSSHFRARPVFGGHFAILALGGSGTIKERKGVGRVIRIKHFDTYFVGRTRGNFGHFKIGVFFPTGK